MSDEENVGPKEKKKRERHNCCVPGCVDVKNSSNHLHKVPSDPGLRKKWAVAIKTGKKLSNEMKVCSKHFNKEDYIITLGAGSKMRLKKFVVPSVNLPLRSHDAVVPSPVKRKHQARSERATKRAFRLGSTSASRVEELSGEEDCNCDGGSSSNVDTSEWEDVPEVFLQDKKVLKDAGVQVGSMVNSGIVSSILSCDRKLFSTTGLHSVKLLNSLTDCFEKLTTESPHKPFLLCVRDRIILTMMKIKLAVSFSSLAVLFDINIQTCINYFYDSVIVLAKVLKCMIFWPDKELILKNMPKCFKGFRSTRVVLDANEIPVEKPKCIRCRIRLYSHYKKTFTSKVMMLCAPSGFIVRCCAAFGGRASDKVVTKATGVYEICDPGDGIMVDKGFQIDDECHDNLITLIRPPFLRKKTQKFSKAESVQCAKIARARVHVERVIQRVREYNILKFKVPWNICKYLDDLVIIVSALVNLGSPILASDKF